jgi:hypothetical protein
MVINDKKVTSQGQGNLNTVLGSVGAAGALFGNGWLGNLLGGLGNNGRNNCCSSDDMPISRYEANLLLAIQSKDSENALLRSNIYTDQKITDTYAVLNGQINELAREVRANKDAQCAINSEQAVFNGVTTGALKCIRENVQELFGLTKLVVPNTSICPGWGSVTITPATAPTTVAGA